MDRRGFLTTSLLFTLTTNRMDLQDLKKLSESFAKTPKMPLLFLGHGSPMNAIEENQFVAGFRNIAKTLPTPSAILCISAHWYTNGTFVTAMEMPKTIHDFGGFPQELFQVQYPAPGSPTLARIAQTLVTSTKVELDDKWGLDHGAWSVIKHLYPKANIPVIQFSIDYTRSPEWHFSLADQLAALRERGVLIIGSGNIIHNLRKIDWMNFDKDNYGYDWAIEARVKTNELITSENFQPLLKYQELGIALQLAVPSPDHYLPLLYILGLKEKSESLELFNDKLLAGSLSMTSVKIG